MRKAQLITESMTRLRLRVPLERKALLQRAAALRGITLTEFVVSAAMAAAVRTIQMDESMALSSADSRAFSAAILHPMPANARLARAAQEYAKRFDDGAESMKVEMVSRVLERATTVLGGEDNASIWMKSSLPALGGKSPLELLSSINGHETVNAILARIASGTF